MYDYGLSVLSHYGLTASGTMRVRGALLCHTEQGDKLISEFGTAAEKLEQRYLLQCRITESGLLRCDQILRNEEGALATRGDDGGTYIVRNWYPGRECETGNSEDLIRASDALARLHTAAHLPVKMEYRRESIVEECIRHNVEIRKIRKYLQTKKKKNEFEKLLLASAGPYLEQGERAAAEMKASSASTIFCWKTAEAKRRSISTSGTSISRWQILAILCGKFWKNMAGASARQNGS